MSCNSLSANSLERAPVPAGISYKNVVIIFVILSIIISLSILFMIGLSTPIFSIATIVTISLLALSASVMLIFAGAFLYKHLKYDRYIHISNEYINCLESYIETQKSFILTASESMDVYIDLKSNQKSLQHSLAILEHELLCKANEFASCIDSSKAAIQQHKEDLQREKTVVCEQLETINMVIQEHEKRITRITERTLSIVQHIESSIRQIGHNRSAVRDRLDNILKILLSLQSKLNSDNGNVA